LDISCRTDPVAHDAMILLSVVSDRVCSFALKTAPRQSNTNCLADPVAHDAITLCNDNNPFDLNDAFILVFKSTVT